MKNKMLILTAIGIIASIIFLGCQNDSVDNDKEVKENQEVIEQDSQYVNSNHSNMHRMMGEDAMSMRDNMMSINQMNEVMDSIMQRTNQNMKEMKISKEMASYMNNMKEVGTNLNSMLAQMNLMMNNKEVMKDSIVNNHMISMIENINPLLDNYKNMMNHFNDYKIAK